MARQLLFSESISSPLTMPRPAGAFGDGRLFAAAFDGSPMCLCFKVLLKAAASCRTPKGFA